MTRLKNINVTDSKHVHSLISLEINSALRCHYSKLEQHYMIGVIYEYYFGIKANMVHTCAVECMARTPPARPLSSRPGSFWPSSSSDVTWLWPSLRAPSSSPSRLPRRPPRPPHPPPRPRCGRSLCWPRPHPPVAGRSLAACGCRSRPFCAR